MYRNKKKNTYDESFYNLIKNKRLLKLKTLYFYYNWLIKAQRKDSCTL